MGLTIIFSLFFFFAAVNCSKLPKNCGSNGHLFNEFSWRIIGGQPSAPGEWPWQVSLSRKIGYRLFCGIRLLFRKAKNGFSMDQFYNF
jgi:secreted trypsin-like serine protease